MVLTLCYYVLIEREGDHLKVRQVEEGEELEYLECKIQYTIFNWDVAACTTTKIIQIWLSLVCTINCSLFLLEENAINNCFTVNTNDTNICLTIHPLLIDPSIHPLMYPSINQNAHVHPSIHSCISDINLYPSYLRVE